MEKYVYNNCEICKTSRGYRAVGKGKKPFGKNASSIEEAKAIIDSLYIPEETVEQLLAEGFVRKTRQVVDGDWSGIEEFYELNGYRTHFSLLSGEVDTDEKFDGILDAQMGTLV